MALSFKSVQKAYNVFHQLGVKNISSFPEDMETWMEKDLANPNENTVYGWSKKSDDGWENIFFFTKNPSEDLKQKFNSLKDEVPNSSISKPYSRNEKYWIFGWF